MRPTREIAASLALLGLLSIATDSVARAEGVDARSAFERLSGLAGTWQGAPESKGVEAEAEYADIGAVIHEIRVSAAGTVVMETMQPGTDHEMINMYHLDDDDLVLTHYCAGGNQPVMRLNLEQSTEDRLVFDFAGGTNLDPATDGYIHDAAITWRSDDTIDSVWTGYKAGQPAGTMAFHLERQQ